MEEGGDSIDVACTALILNGPPPPPSPPPPFLWVQGPKSSGKSTLVGKWCKEWNSSERATYDGEWRWESIEWGRGPGAPEERQLDGLPLRPSTPVALALFQAAGRHFGFDCERSGEVDTLFLVIDDVAGPGARDGPNEARWELLDALAAVEGHEMRHRMCIVATCNDGDEALVHSSIRRRFGTSVVELRLPTMEERVALLGGDLRLAARAHGLPAWQLRRPDFAEVADDLIAAQAATQRIVHTQAALAAPLHWADIGGNAEAKAELRRAAVWSAKRAAGARRFGIAPSRGILLYGPPGTGKTLLARAVATESNASFWAVDGASLIQAEVGESEKAVRTVFAQAAAAQPAVIFIDEFDALFGAKGGGRSGASVGHSARRLIGQLLGELDKAAREEHLVLLAATNRPWAIDASFLSAGRFARIIHIPPPDLDARRQILGIHLKKLPLGPTVSLDTLAAQCGGYSGADLAAVAAEATFCAVARVGGDPRAVSTVDAVDFEQAMRVTPRSISFVEEKKLREWSRRSNT